MKDSNKVCSLCGEDIQPIYNEKGEVVWEYGNNAEPLTDGRACDACHHLVIRARLGFTDD